MLVALFTRMRSDIPRPQYPTDWQFAHFLMLFSPQIAHPVSRFNLPSASNDKGPVGNSKETLKSPSVGVLLGL